MNTDDLIALLRGPHSHAEPGFLEFFTAAAIMDQCGELGVCYVAGAEAFDVNAIAEAPTRDEYAEWSQRVQAVGVDEDRLVFF